MVFVEMWHQIFRACVSTCSKNLAPQIPKKAILINKWGFERSLLPPSAGDREPALYTPRVSRAAIYVHTAEVFWGMAAAVVFRSTTSEPDARKLLPELFGMATRAFGMVMVKSACRRSCHEGSFSSTLPNNKKYFSVSGYFVLCYYKYTLLIKEMFYVILGLLY